MNNDITYKIRPAGRHLLTIGRELIQDNYAAVIELVKNAYDADSPDVNIEFRAKPDLSEYTINISDHGHGMSRDDVINKWLVPSTKDKIDRGKSPSGRILQGSKGVGRYAVAILGNNLLLETVTNKGEKTTVYVEWKVFSEAQYLDDVDILIETVEVSEPSGTVLTINGDDEFLKEWDKKRFEKLRFELKKLTSPMTTPISNENGGDEFRINLTVVGFSDINDISQTIDPYPLFDFFDYKISGNISADGKGTLTYSSQKTRNIPDQKIFFDFGKPTSCGSLDIDIRVYDRDKDAIDFLIARGLKDEDGNYVGKNQARNLLNAYNGIGVYRNGFRIRPLGDAGFDWMKLDGRRVQNPTQRVSSNQVIGYVQILSEDQSDLIEKSARDGLKENNAFNQLQEVTKEVINELEIRRLKFRKNAGLSRSTSKTVHELQLLFSFDTLKQNVRKQLTKGEVKQTTADEVIGLIEKDAEAKNKIAEEILQTIAIYQGQATLGRIVNVILHESGQPLNCFKNDVPNLRHWYESYLKTNDQENLNDLMSIAGEIEESANILVELFDKLDPLAAKKRSTKKSILLKQIIQHALDVFKKGIEENKVSTIVSGPDKFRFLCWTQDISAIFISLIDNSMFWMCEKKISNRQILINLVTDGDTLRYIDYKDTGPGIEPEHNEMIFVPQFTTKPEGMGLGLAIAGEAADRNDLELKAFKSEEGAYFRLQPKLENVDE